MKDRVLVSNQLISSGFPSGDLIIVDAQKDVQVSAISTGGAPGEMVLSPDKKTTLVVDASAKSVYSIDNATEVSTGTIAFSNAPTSVVAMPDNATAYAAIRSSGTVTLFNYTTDSVTNNIAVPTVRTLVLSHNGNVLLAFSDDSDTLTYITTSSNAPTTIAGFNRPVYGVFTSDDSKAFILSCGFECGGSASSVTVLDIASKTPGVTVVLPAAEIAALDSSGANLYVAGTCAQANCTQHGGALSIVNVSNAASPTLTTTKPVDISNGFHQVMAFGPNNKLFIGSRTCDNVSFGCLSIYDTSAGTATVDTPNGDVTGLQPIAGRSVMYVAEGGALRIIDTSTGMPTSTQVSILGRAIDVKAIDQ
ncbi:MAG TPA: hypothetical protein VE998_04060 [Terriglobales bacterium]|nr:hypothetical protein [Terriglobales bacterium]